MKWRDFLICLLMSGCMVGPNYKSPENCVSGDWNPTPGSAELSFSTENPPTAWWKVFQDPLLDKYIEMAATCNKEILTAEANILQARALRLVAASSLFPQVEANVNATKTYFSKNGPVFAGPSFTAGPNANTGLPFTIQTPQIQNLFNALFDASWELDLFGKTRRGVQAAQATYERTIEQRNDLLISVLAEVARNYMEVRSFQMQAKLLRQTIRLTEKENKVIQKRKNTGYDNQLDVERTNADLALARAQLPDVIANLYKGIYTLSILTGNPPETLLEELLPMQYLPKRPEHLAVGLKSDLLRRRPDVRAAERNLAVATANLGVAVAAFFPSVVMTADGGFQSLMVRNWFEAASRTWDIGGNLGLPIFQGGNLVGNLRASRAAESAAGYRYQQTVLSALQEAESALITYQEDCAVTKQFAVATEKTGNLVKLNSDRYTKGLVSVTDLIDSKRQLVNAQENQLNSDRNALLDLIALYKALGGGWQPN